MRNRLRRGRNSPPPYEAFIPLSGTLRISVTVLTPEGERVTATATT